MKLKHLLFSLFICSMWACSTEVEQVYEVKDSLVVEVETIKPLVSSITDTSFHTLKYSQINHYFGNIEKGNSVVCQFRVINNTTEDVYLQDVKGDCHCTVTQWSRNKIEPSDSATIEVSYSSVNAPIGYFHNSIRIMSTASKMPDFLYITGQIQTK